MEEPTGSKGARSACSTGTPPTSKGASPSPSACPRKPFTADSPGRLTSIRTSCQYLAGCGEGMRTPSALTPWATSKTIATASDAMMCAAFLR
ncbi:MAG: hypothetical protein FWE77_05180 [Clostridia bacterium]|nr:hypothetical protein [Clostridia bacterium]